MRLLAPSTAFALRAGVLSCVLFAVMSAQALAQTQAADNPTPQAEQPSVPAEDKPAIVEQKPAPAEAKPAVAEDKPTAAPQTPAVPDAKPAVVEQKPAPAEEKPAVAQDKPAVEHKSVTARSERAVQKRAERHKSVHASRAVRLLKRVASGPHERTMVMLCTRFRTYDASSGTYRGYDGRTHSCR